LTCPLQMRRRLWHPRCRQSLCALANQHATPVQSLTCLLQMRRWLWHPRCRQPLKTNKLIYWIKILLRYSYWISDALFCF
jgi:hypothetical protein